MFNRSNNEAAPVVRTMSPEESNLLVRTVPPGNASPLEVRDALTPQPQNETGALYAGHRGFLLRSIPYLLIWSGLGAGVIWKFGTDPVAVLAFAGLTGLVFLLFRKQDYSHSPAGERADARDKLARLKSQEMAQQYRLQDTAVKSTLRLK